MFRGSQVTAGAVGFLNGANESGAQKTQIKKKFESDAASARTSDSRPDVFVFMTNVALTMAEQEKLKSTALKLGFSACEIFDRSLIRAMLDSPDGFALRFQYLGLPLSEAEQTSFFAKWGDGIQSLVTSSFQRVEKTLERLLFLQESKDVLSGLYVHLELDRVYSDSEIGHYRAFVRMFLREPKHKIYQLLFGSSDRSLRFRSDIKNPWAEPAGIGAGIAGGQWEFYIHLPDPGATEKASSDEDLDRLEVDESDLDSRTEKWTQVGSSSGVGSKEVSTIVAGYSHDDPLIRYRPRLQLKDLEDAGWVILLNKTLSEKVEAIHIYANGYKLSEIRRPDFGVENGPPTTETPLTFSIDELADPWARIKPKMASYFELRFSEATPVRIFASKSVNNGTEYLRRSSPEEQS